MTVFRPAPLHFTGVILYIIQCSHLSYVKVDLSKRLELFVFVISGFC